MKFSKIQFLIIVLLVIIVIFLVFSKNNSKIQNQKGSTPTPTLTEQNYISKSGNMIVDSPKPNNALSLPFSIKGKARVFENVVNYKVLDSKGNKIIEGNTMADAPDVGQFGPFEITITDENLKGKITLELFDYSAKDGSEIDKVSIPVVVK